MKCDMPKAVKPLGQALASNKIRSMQYYTIHEAEYPSRLIYAVLLRPFLQRHF